MIFNEETQELLSLVREFVDKEIIPTVGEYEKRDEFPVELLDKACAMGLNQLCIPAEYGGPGLSNVQVFAIAEQIARGDIGVGTTLIANALASYPVLIAGTNTQKKLWFDTMVEKKFAAFCLTEPTAGSAAGNSKTTAVRVIPAIGVPEGEELDFGGLLGSGPVMKVRTQSPAKMIRRGGRIPAPMQSLKN